MVNKPKDMGAVLEQLSKMVCLFAHDYELRVAVAVAFDAPNGKTIFTAFGNTSPPDIQQLFTHAAKTVGSSEPAGHYEHKVQEG